MRPRLALLTAVVLLGGCSLFHRRGRLDEAQPAHRAAQNASIIGDWVLTTSPDSTAFAGAQTVELSLQPESFTITARYAGRPPVVVSGVASSEPGGGALVLIPQTVTRGAGDTGGPVPAMVPGQAYSVLATAADNTMVFATGSNSVQPTSVWTRKAAAKAAGMVQSVSAGDVNDSTKAPKKKP